MVCAVATHVVNLGGTASILRVLATHRFASLVIGALTTVTRTANNVVSEGTEHTSLAIWIWHSRSCKMLRCLSLPLLVDLQRNNSPMKAKTRDLCILRLAESIGGNLIQTLLAVSICAKFDSFNALNSSTLPQLPMASFLFAINCHWGGSRMLQLLVPFIDS